MYGIQTGYNCSRAFLEDMYVCTFQLEFDTIYKLNPDLLIVPDVLCQVWLLSLLH